MRDSIQRYVTSSGLLQVAVGTLLVLLPCGVQAQWGTSTNGGEITITNYTGTGSTVTVPSTLDGLPVTAIGDSAFSDNTALKSIILPDSITSIGGHAFYACSALTTFTIPKAVTNVGTFAFVNCTKLKSLSVDPLNPLYSALGGVLFNKAQTTLLQFPGGVSGAYTIPGGVTSVVEFAFYNCIKVTAVTIPGSVTGIGDGAFGGCYSMTGISVNSSNSLYCSVGGVLFNKNQTTLVQCPSGKSGAYSVPDGVTKIESYAFLECTGLTGITLPNSLTTIGSSGFEYCVSLASITIPTTVSSIGSYGLWGCFSLTSLTIPDGALQYFDSYVFGYCTSLERVTVSSKVSFILAGAFYDSTNLKGVYFYGNAPYIFGSGVFQDDTNATVYYVSGTTGWTSTFGDRPTAVWPLPDYSVTVLKAMTAGSRLDYKLDVPRGCTGLTIRTTGGSGDVSLYARYGAKVSVDASATQGTRLFPQAGTYDAYSGHTGTNEEAIYLPYPSSGKWYITIYGNTDYSGVSYATKLGDTNTGSIPYGGSVSLPAGLGLNSEIYYSLVVTSGVGLLVVDASDAVRSPDIYLKRGSLPSTTEADRMWKGTEATKTLISAAPSPLAGTYYLMARSSGTPTANTWATSTTGALSASAVGSGVIDTSRSEAQGNDQFAEAVKSGEYESVPVRLMAQGHAPLSSNKARYWTVTHGRVGTYTGPFCGADGLAADGDVAAALDAADATNHQVLLVDWSEGAFDDSTNWWEGLDSGKWIAPVGLSAAALLDGVNSTHEKFNLVGHGWGSYVSYEISKNLKKVTTLVALDPATTATGYSDSKIKFSKYATYSWAFYGCSSLPGNEWQPDFYCSQTRAYTAANTFDVHMDYVAEDEFSLTDDDTLNEDIHKAFAYIVGASSGFPDFQINALTSAIHPWNTTKTNEGSFICNGTFEPATVLYISPK